MEIDSATLNDIIARLKRAEDRIDDLQNKPIPAPGSVSGIGDMFKSTYDTNADGKIDVAAITQGSGSGLDADKLDGHQPGSGNGLDADTLDGFQPGAGNGLDADKLDGQHGAYYLPAGSYTVNDVFNKVLSMDGVGSTLDADLLDGVHADVVQNGSTIAQRTGAGYLVANYFQGPGMGDGGGSPGCLVGWTSGDYYLRPYDLNRMLGNWQTYSPAWSVVSGAAPAIGNGSLTGRWASWGKVAVAIVNLTIGSTSTMGGGPWRFSLPSVPAAIQREVGVAMVLDASPVVSYTASCMIQSGNLLNVVGYNTAGFAATVPITWTTNDKLVMQILYENA